MEYGEAVTSDALDRALAIARVLLRDDPDRSAQAVATLAVAQAYCVCVTDGEDAAERQLSEVHQSLIDDVARRLAAQSPARSARKE
jgi:hypothetical protein